MAAPPHPPRSAVKPAAKKLHAQKPRNYKRAPVAKHSLRAMREPKKD